MINHSAFLSASPFSHIQIMAEEKTQLIRGLTLIDTISLVVGTIIGTGIFLKTAIMSQNVGTPGLVLAAWVAAGVLSLAGALTYAELGVLLPKAGGEYVYLRKAYGDAPAFFYGWMRFVIGSPGSIASLAAGFAIFFTSFFNMSEPWVTREINLFGNSMPWKFGPAQIVAVVITLIFAAINCAGVAFGGRVQSVLTFAKVLGISAIVIGVFLFTPSVEWGVVPAELRTMNLTGVQAFGAAMLAALWAYDGWNNMPMAAGEVKNPGRNIPIALVGGMIIILIIYCTTNLAYFHALPVDEIAASTSAKPVATRAVETFLGPIGAKFVTVAIMLSILGALNGSTLTGARVPYAMARDGLFFPRMANLNARARVPAFSLFVQGVIASILALLGTFDQLTNYVVFASWIFYGLTTAAVFVLRRKMPDAARPYRTLGYPIMPVVFVLVAVWLIINTLQTNPVEAGAGLLLIALGLPFYLYYRRSAKPIAIAEAESGD
jgi:APA family basic amino acid/polyamine antiporter